MANHYVHVLTEIETACGVTLDRVATELPRVAIRPNGQIWIDPSLPPALAGSVARAAIGGPCKYVGKNLAGMRVYESE